MLLYDGTVAIGINFIFFFLSLCQPLLLPFLPFLYFFFSLILFVTSLLTLLLTSLSLSFKLATKARLDSEWSQHGRDQRGPGVAEIEVVIAWRRLVWTWCGEDRCGPNVVRSVWAW